VLLMATDGDVAWQRTAAFGSRITQRCKQATAIVASCPALADELTTAGYPSNSVALVPRAVPIPRERSPKLQMDARAALAAANYDLVTTDATSVALAVGRLDVEHRFGDLVRAWRIVTAHRSHARLWIVGDGPERDNLYRQISDLDQRFRVLIPGTFDGLDDLMQAADLMLVPAGRTVPTLPMLQAVAAGVPLIAADSAGMRQSMTGNYLPYPQGDIKALAANVLQLLDNPAEGIARGAAGRAKAQAGPTPADVAVQCAALISRL
jgi:glycosyltransferase involved in cell wall biosynthesis